MKRLGRAIGVATELGVTMGLMAAGLVILGLWLGRRLDASLASLGRLAGPRGRFPLLERGDAQLDVGQATSDPDGDSL